MWLLSNNGNGEFVVYEILSFFFRLCMKLFMTLLTKWIRIQGRASSTYNQQLEEKFSEVVIDVDMCNLEF